MGDKIKIFPAEINGVNQADEDCELKLTADIVELDTPVGGFDDVDAWIRNLELNGAPGLRYQTWYKYPSSPVSTSSNGWVEIFDTDDAGDEITAEDGTYLLLFKCSFSQTDKEKEAGLQIQLNGTTFVDVRNGVSIDDEYELRNHHDILTIDNSSRIRVRFGQTDGGGTMRLRRLRVTIIRLGA